MHVKPRSIQPKLNGDFFRNPTIRGGDRDCCGNKRLNIKHHLHLHHVVFAAALAVKTSASLSDKHLSSAARSAHRFPAVSPFLLCVGFLHSKSRHEAHPGTYKRTVGSLHAGSPCFEIFSMLFPGRDFQFIQISGGSII